VKVLDNEITTACRILAQEMHVQGFKSVTVTCADDGFNICAITEADETVWATKGYYKASDEVEVS